MEENTCEWYDPSCGLAWIRDEFQAFSLWLWEGMLNGIASAFEAIPVPDFLIGVGTHTMPSAIAWFASPFQLGLGLGIVVTAYTARFILRRIPIIG